MEKIKVISKEKHFFEYIKARAPFYGVFGRRYFIDKDGVHYPEDLQFMVLDENFKVTFKHPPFKKGNFTPDVKRRIAAIEKKKSPDDLRTESTVEDLITNLLVSASLDWSSNTYEKYDGKDEEGKTIEELLELHFKRIPEEILDIEPSSEEFEALESAEDFHNNCIKPNSDSTFDRSIEYYFYTEKGQKMVDKCIEFEKNNTSKTPVQDAWIKVLEKNGLPVHEPFSDWCDLPVMKNIDYSSREELDKKHDDEQRKFKESLTPEMKKMMRETAERMKNESKK